MKKTFLVLIAAIAAASSIQASEAKQSVSTAQYVVSQERIDSMAAKLSAITAKEISKSAPKAVHKTNFAPNTRTTASVERATPARKAVETSG